MALDANFMLQLPTDDSLPSKCWHTGSSRSFHKRYLLLIRRFPSCTPFRAPHGIFLGLRYDLIYASCVYSSFLCTLRLFSVVLSDGGGRRGGWRGDFSIAECHFSLYISEKRPLRGQLADRNRKALLPFCVLPKRPR